VITDARRREVYWSTYEGLDEAGIPFRAAGPAIAKPADLADAVPEFARYLRLDAATVSAASLGLLAEALFANGRPYAGPEALYLRSPDVTISAGPKRVS
jgi:tRNA A37 threonylcarbamoyladenosine modification protein TsaB